MLIVAFLLQPIDFKGFQMFMQCYLDSKLPADICKQLFRSFQKTSRISEGKDIFEELLRLSEVVTSVSFVSAKPL